MADNFDWVNQREKEIEESRSKDYFKISEGSNRFLLLSHFAPLAQTFNPGTKKYEIAEPGDKGASVKGVCWVAQEDPIDGIDGETEWNVKQAKLPYTVVKLVRDLSTNDDWDFKLPFPHMFTLTATGAGTKEVTYSLQPSPKQVEIPAEVMEEYERKITPEEIVEKIKSHSTGEDPGNE